MQGILNIGKGGDWPIVDRQQTIADLNAGPSRGGIDGDVRDAIAAIEVQFQANVFGQWINPQIVEAPFALCLRTLAAQVVNLMTVDASTFRQPSSRR